MSDKVWHYTVGDDQFGPVTSDELKKLAAAGKVNPTDQVWKEGMDDWMPANKMQGLFSGQSGDGPVIKEMPSDSPPRRGGKLGGKPRMKLPASFDPLRHIQPYAHAVLLVGFLLVIASRGCDSIGNRYVARAKSQHSLAVNTFDDKWNYKLQDVRDDIDEERDEDKPDQEVLKKLDDKQKKIREDRDKARDKLKKGHWNDLQIAARDAVANNAINGYWREMLFVFGTLTFVVGLITVGFRGEGAERTICLIMLAIITVSLYVVGVAWIGSVGPMFGR